MLLLQRTGGAAGTLSFVLLSSCQSGSRRLFASAQLGLDAGCGVAGGGPPALVAPGVVVVVGRAALPASLLLVQPLRLPELCSPVLEPNLAERTGGYNSVCSGVEELCLFVSLTI